MINLGSAVGYLLLDTTSFSDGIKKSIDQLAVFKKEGATATDKLTGLGSALTGAGKTLTKNVTTPLVGLGTLATKASIDFESAFTGVRKTVDATEDEFAALSKGIKDMSGVMPQSASEIAGVMEVAGQLGVRGTDNLLQFTKTMVMLGDATNLSSEEAATSIARVMNIMGTSGEDVSRFGATIVDLGNNFATTESEIVSMTNRLAAGGKLAGLTEPEIMALATAMSSVGIEAEAGGTAMTQTFNEIEMAVANGGDTLAEFARVSGMSAEEFSSAWKTSPITAIQAFITGLGKLDEQGESAVLVLDDLGLKGIRQSNMLKSLGLASDLLADSIDTANNAWEENTALVNEAETRYGTTESKLAMLRNSTQNLAASFGELLTPMLDSLNQLLRSLIDWLSGLSDKQKKAIVDILKIVATIGPVLLILGKTVTTVVKVIEIVGKVRGVISKLIPILRALWALLSANPVGIIVAAIAALVAGFIYLWNNCEGFRQFWIDLCEDIKKVFKDVVDWIVGAFNDVGEFFSSIGEWISTAFNDIVKFFKELPGKIGTWLSDTWKSISEWFSKLPENIAYWLGYLVGTIVTWWKETDQKVEEWFTELFTSIGEWISNAYDDVVTFFSELPRKLWDWLTGIAGDIRKWGSDTLNSIVNWFTTTWENITTFLSELPGKVWEWLKETFNKVVEWGSNIWTKAREIISTFINRIVDGLRSLPGKFKEWFTSAINYLRTLPSQMLQLGKNIFNGLWDGLKSIWNKLTGWIDGVVGKIRSLFGKAREGYNDATRSTYSVRGHYASGLDYVPRDMNVRVHQGEAILTKEENANRVSSGSVFGNVVINIDGAKYNDEESLARAVSEELQILTERKGMVWK